MTRHAKGREGRAQRGLAHLERQPNEVAYAEVFRNRVRSRGDCPYLAEAVEAIRSWGSCYGARTPVVLACYEVRLLPKAKGAVKGKAVVLLGSVFWLVAYVYGVTCLQRVQKIREGRVPCFAASGIAARHHCVVPAVYLCEREGELVPVRKRGIVCERHARDVDERGVLPCELLSLRERCLRVDGPQRSAGVAPRLNHGNAAGREHLSVTLELLEESLLVEARVVKGTDGGRWHGHSAGREADHEGRQPQGLDVVAVALVKLVFRSVLALPCHIPTFPGRYLHHVRVLTERSAGRPLAA